MAKRTKARYCLDTSALRYLCIYGDQVRLYVEGQLAGGSTELSQFVMMEYYRGVIIHLIDIYFVIKNAPTPQSAFDYLSNEFKVGKLRLIVQGALSFLCGFEGSNSKAATLARLGNYIFELGQKPSHPECRNRIGCTLGSLAFPSGVFREDAMLVFREKFNSILKSPACGQCGFRNEQTRRLTRTGVDLYSVPQRTKFSTYSGYVKQAVSLEKSTTTKRKSPSCWWCEKLGDSIIAIECHRRSVLVTSDRSFEPLCTILGKSILLLPSPKAMLGIVP